jgi:uroporphyrin-III C-methyltransferase
VNVADAPELCTFTLLSTYSDGPLHVGITTSGRGCKLASRIRREIASFLPSGLGSAVDVLGNVRRRIWEEDSMAEFATELQFDLDDDDSAAQKHTFNALVTPEDPNTAKTRRIRWLSQLCEYWPLKRLAAITGADMDRILEAYRSTKASCCNGADALPDKRKKGKIILAGSGPGHPDLLTRATYQAIKTADLILSDKLVPAAVLDLIPRRTEVHIARKFPGNADKAQEEFLEMGLEGLRAGRTVLRLKQGDPYLYGRGAEEYEFFRNEGYIPTVLPGITSALSAPLFADITPTHRGVADQVLICTGTGRHGAAPDPPAYIPTQTVVFLMALHRLSSLVESLTCISSEETNGTAVSRRPWPKDTPCAVIERASCADQRVIRTTLEHVCLAVQEEGSRPPGLLVVGRSCEVLHQRELGKRWAVEDGYRALDELEVGEDMAALELPVPEVAK